MDTTLPTSSPDSLTNRPAPSPCVPAKSETSKLEAMEEMDNGCEEVPSREFTIATHFVKVKRSGTLTDVTTLWDLVGTEAVSGSLDDILDSRPGFDRLPSINAFDKVGTMHIS